MSIRAVQSQEFGVTENKKSTLNTLTIKVVNAMDEVIQLQVIVDLLTNKLATYQGFLAQANANQTEAQHNITLLNTVIKNASNLKDNSEITFKETINANEKATEVAQNFTSVMNKLIYTAEMINKLSNLITRKKAQNPLISDQLITLITTVGTNTNNAVALSLVALNSTYAAQATNKEVTNIAGLETVQASKLYNKLTSDTKTNTPFKCLNTLLNNAYTDAVTNCNKMQKAYNETLNQLNLKTSDLNKAQINLQSLQAGLAAANAATLAS